MIEAISASLTSLTEIKKPCSRDVRGVLYPKSPSCGGDAILRVGPYRFDLGPAVLKNETFNGGAV